MRPVRKFILHASGHERDTLASLDRRHLSRGLKSIGFHFVICENGRLERGRPLSQPGAHCLGHNADSVGICLSGTGWPTFLQVIILRRLLLRLHRKFPRAELYSFGQLDPWERDPLKVDLDSLRKEMQT